MYFTVVYTDPKGKRRAAAVEAKTPEAAMKEVMNYPDCMEICAIKLGD